MVRARDVDGSSNKVVDVELSCSAGIYWDIDDKLASHGIRDRVVKVHRCGNKLRVWGVKVKRVPVFVLDDGIAEVADRLSDGAPFVRARGASECEPESQDRQVIVWELCAGLEGDG